jgi:transcription antitermination factor NusG
MQAVEKLETKSLPQQWCMLLVRPGMERDARDSFHRYGVRAYWPNYHSFLRSTLPLRERRRRDYRSVIPGYLFVPALPTETFWDIVERIPGVENVVRGFSGDLAMLKDADIDVIRSIEAGMNTPIPGRTPHNFKTGDKVGFIDDNAQRWPPGRIGGSSNDGRITVEIGVMGRLVPRGVSASDQKGGQLRLCPRFLLTFALSDSVS